MMEKGFPIPKKGRENETVFDYYLRFNASNCAEWALCSPETWKAPKVFNFSQVIIPTADTERASKLLDYITDSRGPSTDLFNV